MPSPAFVAYISATGGKPLNLDVPELMGVLATFHKPEDFIDYVPQIQRYLNQADLPLDYRSALETALERSKGLNPP